MAGAFTDYLEGQLIAHLFRTASFTKPSHLYIALFTAAPGESGGGTEVSGGSYARQQLDPLDATWAAPVSGDGTTSNVSDIVFPAPTANWGTIVSVGIFDASTSGNLLFYGSLTTSQTVSNGDGAPKFVASALSVVLD